MRPLETVVQQQKLTGQSMAMSETLIGEMASRVRALAIAAHFGVGPKGDDMARFKRAAALFSWMVPSHARNPPDSREQCSRSSRHHRPLAAWGKSFWFGPSPLEKCAITNPWLPTKMATGATSWKPCSSSPRFTGRRTSILWMEPCSSLSISWD